RVPALRSRAEDIPLIARTILARLAGRGHGEAATLTSGAEAALLLYEFPGNVRELENILERAVALTPGGVLASLDLMLPQQEVDLLLEPEPDAAGPGAIDAPASITSA